MTTERAAVFWDTLCDLPIGDVVFACQHAARYWRPSEEEGHFLLPSTLRDYAALARDKRLQQAQEQARKEERKQIPAWSETPDELGLQAIRNIMALLDKTTDMARIVPKEKPTGSNDPLYYRPTEDPEEAKARLREQFRLLHTDPEETV